jgi:Tol biopolymer transport system component
MSLRKTFPLFLRALFAAFVVVAPSAFVPASAEVRVEPPPPCDEDVSPPCPPAKDRPPSWFPSISGDGRYIVFYSAHHLVLDGNAGGLFRLDRSTGAVDRVNVDTLGRILTRYYFGNSISHDGDRVAFAAVDWGAPLEDPPQIWVREFSTGRTILASPNAHGLPSEKTSDPYPRISPDGRFVGYLTQVTENSAYVRDLELATTTLIGSGASTPFVSTGGRYVVFHSNAPLLPEAANITGSLYLRDMQSGQLTLVSRHPSGAPMKGPNVYDVSDDGSRVLFGGSADAAGRTLYVWDRTSGHVQALAEPKASNETGPGNMVSISGDGNVAAVQTTDPVGLSDFDGRDDVVLVDTHNGQIRPTTPDTMLDQPDAPVFAPSLSYDGDVLAVNTAWRNSERTDTCCNRVLQRDEIYTYTRSTNEWKQVTPRPAVLPNPLPPVSVPVPALPALSGYWMLGEGGDVYSFGAAGTFGNGGAGSADIESTPAKDGYWILDRAGRVTSRGAAQPLGNAALRPGESATSLSATPSGRGYWVFTDAGRVVTVGDAVSYGDMAGARLNGPVLDSVVAPSGRGYWMVAGDGGIFSFGDARFHGSMGGHRLNKPVVSMAPDPDGSGYWLVASDGGIFAFDAPFYGSMGAVRLNKPVTGMVTGRAGYLMVATDGGIFAFGDVPFAGSLGASPPPHPIVAVALR